jgi:pimeloyl-ACP methyl ester carboxylesterase
MSQLVFIHGPGAGSCSAGYKYQKEHFPNCLTPDLPGHPDGDSLDTVEEYTEWLHGYLHQQGHLSDVVLSGFTLGACVALQYALDYPDEVAGLLLMTIAMRPKERAPGSLEFRLNAAKDEKVHEEWLDAMRHSMMFIESGLREQLIECHRIVGPISQYNDLVTIDNFDVQDRISELETPLVLVRGLDDPGKPAEYELEIHEAVTGSKYVKLEQAGHFPMAERPDDINKLIEELMA